MFDKREYPGISKFLGVGHINNALKFFQAIVGNWCSLDLRNPIDYTIREL